MAQNTVTESLDASATELAASLAKLTVMGDSPSQTSQIQHRLNIILKWFGSLHEAQIAFQGSSVFEIGCGQGDMTVPLTYLCSQDSPNPGTVTAIDPAGLDYGAPFTLGQSQSRISSSHIGPHIRWTQREPLEYLGSLTKATDRPNFLVLAHSIWYLPSERYFSELLRALAGLCKKAAHDRPVRLLLAEWGLRQSNDNSRAHVLAVELQEEAPWKDGNVRNAMRPERIRQLAEGAGWALESEGWIAEPEVEDGKWEVANVTRKMETDRLSDGGRRKLQEMKALKESEVKLGAMDVWTGVFTPR